MKRAFWLAAPLALGGLAYLLLREPERHADGLPTGRQPAAPSSSDDEVALARADEEAATEPSVASPRGPSEHRTPAHAPVLEGRIIDADGTPVPGATISWSPLPDRRILAPLEWHEIDWEEARRASEWTTSDARGFFLFDAAPEPDPIYGSVIWITHPEWQAVSKVLGPERERGALGSLVTSRAERRTVSVVDGQGSPVADATVWQLSAGTAASTDEELALRAFFRRAATDERGQVPAYSIGGREALFAEKEAERSEPHVGPSAGSVRLTLSPTFSAHGSIVLTDGAILEPWPRVTWGAVRGDEFEALGTQQHEGGAWGPVQIPLVEADAYRFRVHGGGVVAVEQDIEPPVAGQLVRVDLETIQGIDLWFLVLNPEREILHDASVDVMWAVGKEWPRLPSPPARKDGYIYVRGSMPGTVYYEVTAPGYERARFGPNVIPEPELTTWEVVIERAGSVAGRCLSEGAPVTDFEISTCHPGASYARLVHKFPGQADGRFELSLAEGEQVLIAYADGLGQSEPVHVTVVAGQTHEVDLVLEAFGSGIGRVVDALEGQPIAGAEVERGIAYDRTTVGTIGATVRTDGEGRFTLEGLGPSGSVALVSAPGYATQVRSATPGEPMDFGTIELVPTRRAEFVLPEGVQPRGFKIAESGATETLPFSASGVAVIEAIEAGWHLFHVTYPDSSLLEFAHTFGPGEDWTVPVPADAGDRRLRVTVTPPDGEALAADLWLSIHCPGGEGGVRRRRPVLDDSPIVFDALPSGHVLAVVIDSRRRYLASAEVDLSSQSEATLRLELESEPHRFRVLDGEGRPVDSARIELRVLGRDYVHIYGQTDSDGELVFHGLPDGELFVGVTHEHAGALADIPVELDEDGNMTLVLDDQRELAVQLLDRGTPLEGRRCDLRAPRTHWWVGSAITDSTGTARWPRLGPGEYVVEFEGAGYWPVSETVSATRDEVARIPVLRLGGIELELRGADGFPAPGVAIDVRSIELDAPITRWAEEGKWVLPEGGLVSDRQGRIRLEGLPHGAYSWTAAAGDGLLVGGSFQVPPGEVGEAVLHLQ